MDNTSMNESAIHHFASLYKELRYRPYNEAVVKELISSLGCKDMEEPELLEGVGDRVYRYYFGQEKSPRTLFLTVDNQGTVTDVDVKMKHYKTPSSELNQNTVTVLISLVGVVILGFMIYGVSSFVTGIFDGGSDSDYDNDGGYYDSKNDDFDSGDYDNDGDGKLDDVDGDGDVDYDDAQSMFEDFFKSKNGE